MASGIISLTSEQSRLEGRIVWESVSQGSSANNSYVAAHLQARKNDGYWSGGTFTGSMTIGGTTNSFSQYYDLPASTEWVTLLEFYIYQPHNNDGTGSCNISASFKCTAPTNSTLYNKNVSGSQNVSLDTIPRYANFTEHYISGRTSNSLSVHWNADAACDWVQYSLNGGEWINTSGLDYTISGLDPNTNYNIRTRIKRADSQLWSESSYIYGTTFQKTIPSISLSSKTINSIVVSSSCNVNVSSTQYRIRKSGGTYGNYQNSATFTGLEANTTYIIEVRKVGSDSGEAGTAELRENTYNFALLTSYPNFDLGNSETIQYSNPSGSTIDVGIYDTNGVNAYAAYRTVVGSSYTFTFTDDEFDKLYKAMGNGNTLIVRLYIRTTCNGITYTNHQEVIVTLKGNQKVGHIKINNSVKRAKGFIGINNDVKRFVIWIGDHNSVPRRCI